MGVQDTARETKIRELRNPKGNAAICGRFSMMRRHFGDSQEVCARKLGVSVDRIVSYENLRTPIPSDVALKFCWKYLVNERWLAECTLPIFPSLDLINEPVFIEVDPKTPYETAYPIAFATIANKVSALSFPSVINRLIVNSDGNVDRLRGVYDYLYIFLGETLRKGIVSQMLECTIRDSMTYLKTNGISLDIHKGCVNGGSFVGPMGSGQLNSDSKL